MCAGGSRLLEELRGLGGIRRAGIFRAVLVHADAPSSGRPVLFAVESQRGGYGRIAIGEGVYGAAPGIEVDWGYAVRGRRQQVSERRA
jgi:hypothetical protein